MGLLSEKTQQSSVKPSDGLCTILLARTQDRFCFYQVSEEPTLVIRSRADILYWQSSLLNDEGQ